VLIEVIPVFEKRALANVIGDWQAILFHYNSFAFSSNKMKYPWSNISVEFKLFNKQIKLNYF